MYSRRVAYADTDAMGVVHHSNYVRYFEETRVAWMRERGLIEHHAPRVDITLAVIHCAMNYRRYLKFDDLIDIRLQVRIEGLKIRFAYGIFCGDRWGAELICSGETVHVPVDSNMRVVRISEDLKRALEMEKWNETWLSNLSESPKPRPSPHRG